MQFEMVMFATTLSVIRSAVDARAQAGVGFIYAPFLQFFLKLDLKVCRGDTTSLPLEYLTTFLVMGELRNQGCCCFLRERKMPPPPFQKRAGGRLQSACLLLLASCIALLKALGADFIG